MSSRRPRRSRIYDLNYNIGENYYKSALDRLDEKSSRPPSSFIRSSEPPASRPSVRLAQLAQDDASVDDCLDYARARASQAIQRETILDQRSGRKAELEADFDSQVSKTLDRINASKKLLSNIDVENGYDNDIASSAIIRKRIVKVTSDVSTSSASNAQSNNDLVRWTKLGSSNDSESFAAQRARQSAARLQDIENDMVERSERQFRREQRSANVKKLLAESSDLADDAASYGNVASYKMVKSTQKRITSY